MKFLNSVDRRGKGISFLFLLSVVRHDIFMRRRALAVGGDKIRNDKSENDLEKVKSCQLVGVELLRFVD